MTIQNFDWVYFWDTANYVSWYEYLALICFGCAWWFSIRNSSKTKLFEGKSDAFLWLVILACCCGVCGRLFVDLNFKILFYIVNLCGALLDYYVRRRLRLEQNIKERKQVLTGRSERDWSYGNEVYKKSSGSRHTHRRHREGEHRHSKKISRSELTEDEKKDVVRSSFDEVEFDNINE